MKHILSLLFVLMVGLFLTADAQAQCSKSAAKGSSCCAKKKTEASAATNPASSETPASVSVESREEYVAGVKDAKGDATAKADGCKDGAKAGKACCAKKGEASVAGVTDAKGACSKEGKACCAKKGEASVAGVTDAKGACSKEGKACCAKKAGDAKANATPGERSEVRLE